MRAARNAASPLSESCLITFRRVHIILFLSFLRRTIFVRLYLLCRLNAAPTRRDALFRFVLTFPIIVSRLNRLIADRR